MDIQQLKQSYEAAKAANPKTRIRDLATSLHTSEAQLVALGLGEGTIRLEGDFRELLKEVHTLGPVMALTRNNDAVHERHGVYNNVSFDGQMGLVLDEDIDLRLFMMHWAFGFAVIEGERRSLQFFDKSGEAVHKIYLTEQSNEAAYHTLAEKYMAGMQEPELLTKPYAAPAEEAADEDIDVNGFRADWLTMTDTHQFFGIVRKYGLSRMQALRLAPEGYVQEVPATAMRQMLESVSELQVPIMVFVANRGCIQIHSGEVTKLLATGPWFNVLDPQFNLHLREEKIAAAYVVKKPSNDGIVTSVEVFDAEGTMIIQFFGKRKPGIPELERWRSIASNLTTADVSSPA